MISTVKREIAIEKELLSKIEWACTFGNCEPKIKNGNLRMVEKTNIAYVEPHSVVIKGKLSRKNSIIYVWLRQIKIIFLISI